MGSFWGDFGLFLDGFRGHFRSLLDHFEIVLASFWDSFDVDLILDFLGMSFGSPFGPFLSHFSPFLGHLYGHFVILLMIFCEVQCKIQLNDASGSILSGI